MRTRMILTTLFLAASFPAANAGDSDPATAEATPEAVETCLGCHGVSGYTNAYPSYNVPKLGGQTEEYLVASLRAYATGAREHPTMRAQGSSITDEDIRTISAWIADQSRKTPAADPKARATGSPARGRQVARGESERVMAACSSCHGEEGREPTVPSYPVLAGQYADYLFQSLKQYKDGERSGNAMSSQAAKLTEQDMRDLAAWFASRESRLATLPK